MNDISLKLIENFEAIEFFFNLDLQEYEDHYKGCCPLHADSDNPAAFTLYKDSGAWICHTHGCHNIFKGTMVGLVRGLLSVNKLGWSNFNDTDKVFGFRETLSFIEQFLEKRPNLPIDSKRRHHKNKAKKEKLHTELNLAKETFLQNIQCPPEYYINRGFSEEILRKYCIGYYDKPYKPLSKRILVPIFSDDGQTIIGCSGRTSEDKCLVCDGYHDSRAQCPDQKSEPWMFQKWKHNKGFRRERYLYNYWNMYGKNWDKIILVEGPSEVWKLEECGIHNSLAIFGSNMTAMQAEKIASLRPRLITTIMDADDGGEHAELSCKKEILRVLPDVKIQHLCPPKNDLGDMTHKEIITWLKNI